MLIFFELDVSEFTCLSKCPYTTFGFVLSTRIISLSVNNTLCYFSWLDPPGCDQVRCQISFIAQTDEALIMCVRMCAEQ